nr:ABC transporter permease [Olsenella profusa]
MVEDERVQIGTYKALGYSTARIAGKYLAYAGAAALTGAVLGVAVLTQVLPFIVSSAYGIIYAVPQQGFPLPIDPMVALTSGGLGVAVTLLATWAAVVSSLRETPAALMQPRAPRAGRRILLERVRPLWRRLSFSWKVTCRNLFRYKKRLLMTVVGISGCTALLLVGLGLHDAIWDIIDNQFGPIAHYDTTVSLDETATAADADAVDALIGSTDGSRVLARAQLVNVQAGSNAADGTISVQVVVPEDPGSFDDAVSLRERVSQRPLSLVADGSGIILGEKTATKLGVAAGDTVTVFGQDAVGTATGTGCTLTVSGIAENYVGSVAYLAPAAWETLRAGGVVDAEEPSFSTIYATTSPDAATRNALTDELQGTGHVSTVAFTDETVAMYREMLSAVDLIVVVLIVSAAALAFIVLYNLTNINIGERVREIATLKVLGFKRGEVGAYIFREIALLALLGDALGMVLGTWLEGFVIVTAEVDVVMFGRVIHPLSYLGAFALTLVFSALVMLAMRRRLDAIDMVESLKSVD